MQKYTEDEIRKYIETDCPSSLLGASREQIVQEMRASGWNRFHLVTKNITSEEEWQKYCEQLPLDPFSQKYPNGKKVKFRCPYCGNEVDLDPHLGCCGEIHYESIPPYELNEY